MGKLVRLLCGSDTVMIPNIYLEFFSDLILARTYMELIEIAPKDEPWFLINLDDLSSRTWIPVQTLQNAMSEIKDLKLLYTKRMGPEMRTHYRLDVQEFYRLLEEPV